MRAIKDHLYAQVARIGRALASPKRLELVELLCQGEKTVEQLAAQSAVSVKLASGEVGIVARRATAQKAVEAVKKAVEFAANVQGHFLFLKNHILVCTGKFFYYFHID